MKKLTAVISAAAIAATMVVPITAGAATTELNAGSNKYTAIPADALSAGKYTAQLSVTTADKAGTFYVRLANKESASTHYINALDIFAQTSSDNAAVRYGYSRVDSNNPTPNANAYGILNGEVSNSQVYLKGNATYDVTINVDGTTVSVDLAPATGSAFANSTMTCPTLTFTIPEGITPGQIWINNNSSSRAGVTVSDVTFTVPEEETPATAETKKVDAVLNGESVQIGNTTVTNTASDNIVVDGKYITFYKTTVTAGTNNVTGVKIKPKDYKDSAKQVNVNAEAGKTDSFYSAVISAVVTNLSADEWTYEFE